MIIDIYSRFTPKRVYRVDGTKGVIPISHNQCDLGWNNINEMWLHIIARNKSMRSDKKLPDFKIYNDGMEVRPDRIRKGRDYIAIRNFLPGTAQIFVYKFPKAQQNPSNGPAVDMSTPLHPTAGHL